MIISKEAASIVSLPVDPDIRENVCFVGFDPQRAIGYFIQLSRWCLDSAIWREQVQVFLPDGDYLLHRGWGRDDSRQEPSGALLKVNCDEPERRWRIRYRGPARRTTAQELSRGPMSERTPQLLDLDVTFESEYDIWQMRKKTADKWEHSHSEQPGKIHGRIEAGGQTVDIESVGYRNHSRGTRKLSAVFDHCWAHGRFVGGRVFAILSARIKTAEESVTTALSQAMIWDAGRLHVATCKEPPLLGDTQHSLTEPPDRFTFDLESDLGSMRIDAQAAASIPHSTTLDGEWLDGVVTDASLAYLVAYERPTLFSWNGESGCGHTEQSRRIPAE